MKRIRELSWLEMEEDIRDLSDFNGNEREFFAKPDYARKEIKASKKLLFRKKFKL